MAWSSTAPTLPAGASWGNAQTVTSHTVYDIGSFQVQMTVYSARGVGSAYYVWIHAYYQVYTPGGSYYRPTHYLYPDLIQLIGANNYASVDRYYTGSGSPDTLRVGLSTSGTSASGSLFVDVVIPAVYLFTVDYDGNGADGGGTESQIKTAGTDLTLRANGFTRDKYAFAEWNTAADGSGTGYAAGASYAADEAVTLYAVWKKANVPVFVNAGGAVKQVEKAYANIGGAVKEAAVYVNVGGEIRELV